MNNIPNNIQRRFATSVPRDRDATPRTDLTDTERLEFCHQLAQSDKVEVSDWESPTTTTSTSWRATNSTPTTGGLSR